MSGEGNRFLALLHSPRDHPVIVAHRGDSFRAPENTLDAARLAWQAGAEAWELDVQLTHDGVPIVLHDESLLRTTDVAARFKNDPRAHHGFRVSDFDFSEVRTLDAGSWFVAADGKERSARAFGTLDSLAPAWVESYRSGRVIIPTLAEALTLAKEYNWLVNVEIKSFPERPPGLVDRVLEVIHQTHTASRVLLSSFDHTDIVAANRQGREYGLAILTMTPLHRTLDYVIEFVGADAIHLSSEVVGSESIAYRRQPSPYSLQADLISESKERQIPILVYTVNEQGPNSLAQHLARIGVKGIFTDDPQGLSRDFRRNLSAMTGDSR